jgi:hypothetical protein
MQPIMPIVINDSIGGVLIYLSMPTKFEIHVYKNDVTNIVINDNVANFNGAPSSHVVIVGVFFIPCFPFF